MRREGFDPVASAFIALLNEFSDLPDYEVGFMHIIWDMRPTPQEVPDA